MEKVFEWVFSRASGIILSSVVAALALFAIYQTSLGHVRIVDGKLQYENESVNLQDVIAELDDRLKHAETISSEIDALHKQSVLFTANLNNPATSAGWRRIYENNSEGKELFGNVADLIAAIKMGADIKILSGGSTHNCEWVFFKEGDSPIVHCMNTNHISVSSDDTTNIIKYQDKAYHWFTIHNSNGMREMSRWFIGGSREDNKGGHNQVQTDITWFAKLI